MHGSSYWYSHQSHPSSIGTGICAVHRVDGVATGEVNCIVRLGSLTSFTERIVKGIARSVAQRPLVCDDELYRQRTGSLAAELCTICNLFVGTTRNATQHRVAVIKPRYHQAKDRCLACFNSKTMPYL